MISELSFYEESEESHQVFVTLLYGNDKEELFNPFCKSLLLLEFLKEKYEIDSEVKLDLMDMTGKLTSVFASGNLQNYASELLKGRKRYILVKVVPQKKKGPKGETLVKYESMLENIDERFPTLALRLKKLTVRRSSPAVLKKKNKTQVTKPQRRKKKLLS